MLKITIIGSDKRSLKVGEILGDYYKNSLIIYPNSKEELFDYANVYLLPIPMSIDKLNLNTPKFTCSISEFFNKVSSNALIISTGTKHNKTIDISQRDDFAYKNAVPTAEGAIKIAIEATHSTLSDSNILITGFGRVAKILSHRVFPFTKNLTVAARKPKDIANINALGINAMPIENIAENIGQFDIIFNTVPYEIFNEKTLSAAKSGSVFIELASSELGFNKKAVQSGNFIYINAPALPSKTAPTSAGKIMAETVITVIKENNLI